MTDTAAPILECRNLSISYRTRHGMVPAVVGFDLAVMPGEAVGLVGESGCGKSTVALAIMRHLGRNGAITGGSIMFLGQDITALSPDDLRDIRGSRMSMVYQEPMASLNPSMRAGEQLIEVLAIHERASVRAATDRAIALLRRVHLPDPARIMHAYPHQLSGGQQQRVLIAMALLANPRLLLLDEPTTALDVTVEAGLIELIQEIAAEFGTAMIYISHNLGLIRETCQRLTIMYSGQAVEHGAVADVFRTMRHPYTRGLFHSIPLPWADRETRPLSPIRGQLPLPAERPAGCSFGPRCDWFVPGVCDKTFPMQTVSDAAGHVVRCIRHADIVATPKSAAHAPEVTVPGEPVLQVTSLQKYYRLGRGKVVKANERIDFAARAGETVAIVGESGCGKSTFAKVLVGLEAATGGEIRLQGQEISQLAVRRRGTKLIESLQIVFQNPFETLNPSHTVGAQLSRAIRKFKVASKPADVERRMLELLDVVKLPRAFADRRPRQLSGGQKQRIGVARAFCGRAKVVVADEPLSALDVSVQAAIMSLLLEIQRTQRTAMIFISHDLSVVRYLADRVIVMYLGQVMESGTVAQVYAPPYHPYTEALLSAVPIADASVRKKRIVLSGELPSPIDPPPGCPFQTRCPRKIGPICEQSMPERRQLADGHSILCHLPDAVLAGMEPVFAVQQAAST